MAGKQLKKKYTPNNKGTIQETVTIFRAILSVLLLIIAYSVNAASFISTVILVFAAIISGIDLIIAAAEKIIRKREYLNNQLLICLCAIACFSIGCYIETIVMLAIYQICRSCLNIVIRKTKRSVADCVTGSREEDSQIRSTLIGPHASENSIADKYLPFLELFSKAAFVVGILFAVAVPFFTDMTYIMSIRRGCMLIMSAVPVSALAAHSVYSFSGIGCAAKYGIYIKDAKTLESVGNVTSIIYDKFDVFTDGTPKLTTVNSPILDKESFLMLAAYTAYQSEQRFAAPIISSYSGNITPTYISDFEDIPGCGMQISLKGKRILLGTLDLFDAKGITIPDSERKSGYILFLAIGDKYAGSITLKEKINPYAESVISDLSAIGNIKSVLITEDGRDISEKLSKAVNADELYYECNFADKAGIIQKQKESLAPGEALMYISAENLEYHTAADIDAKIGSAFNCADMLMNNTGIYSIPMLYTLSHTIKLMSKENLIFTLIVKLVLVILAITGSITMWFIVLLDFSSAILGVLSAARLQADDK